MLYVLVFFISCVSAKKYTEIIQKIKVAEKQQVRLDSKLEGLQTMNKMLGDSVSYITKGGAR